MGGLITPRLRETYPPNGMLVATMNPCPCGSQGDPSKECTCSALQIQRYRARISGPLLDRRDIQVGVPVVRYKELATITDRESSGTIRDRVDRARQMQLQRFHGRKIYCNAQMAARDLKKFCTTEPAAEQLLERAMVKLGLSARAYTRILKVAIASCRITGTSFCGPSVTGTCKPSCTA